VGRSTALPPGCQHPFFDERLSGLEANYALALSLNVILLSAVWQ
jgi:hypothetical protein